MSVIHKYVIYNRKFNVYHRGGSPFTVVDLDEAGLYGSVSSARVTVASIEKSTKWPAWADRIKYSQLEDLEIQKVEITRVVKDVHPVI